MTDRILPLLADAADLASGLSGALSIIMMFGFLFGTVTIISGAVSIKRGESETGKMAIVAGIIIAAAPAIMFAIFTIFGLGSSAIKFK